MTSARLGGAREAGEDLSTSAVVKILVVGMVFGVGLLYTLMVPFRPRFFSDTFTAEKVLSDDLPVVVNIRLASLFFLLMCALALLGYRLLRNERIDRSAFVVWLLGSLFFVSSAIAPVIGGEPVSKETLVVVPIVLAAVTTLQKKDLPFFLNTCRLVCLITIYGSLIVAIYFRDFALGPSDDSTILGLSRLHGIAYHANGLSLFPVLFFGLDIARNRTNWLTRPVHWVAATAVLIWSQSKTTWIAVIVGVVVAWVFSRRWRFRIVLLCLLTAALAAGALFFHSTVLSMSRSALWERLPTVAGRVEVWEYSVETWKRSPVFGYGPFFLRDERSLDDFYSDHGWMPGQAHNQFFQTLGEGGMVGVLTWTAYLFSLIYLVSRTRGRSHSVAIFLLVFLLVKSTGETPFKGVPLSEAFFFQIAFVGFLLDKIVVSDDKARSTANVRGYASRRKGREASGDIDRGVRNHGSRSYFCRSHFAKWSPVSSKLS